MSMTCRDLNVAWKHVAGDAKLEFERLVHEAVWGPPGTPLPARQPSMDEIERITEDILWRNS